jgi:hypothetical protein
MGFNQQKLLDFNLDLTDALILRYFIDFKNTDVMKSEIVDNKVFYWVDYKTLMKEIPVIRISHRNSLMNRLKKLVEKGILVHYTKKLGGTWSYYNLGENYKILVSNSTATSKEVGGATQNVQGCNSKCAGGATQNVQGVQLKMCNKDSSISNPSISNSSINIKTIFEFWNEKEIIKHTKLNDKIKTKINTILKSYKVDEVKKGIENYNTMLKDTDYVYCSYKWSLADFLSRANGFIEFLEDGSKWVNYQESKNNNTTGKQNNYSNNKKDNFFDDMKKIAQEGF